MRPATAVAGAPSAAAAKAAVTTSPAAETQPTADAANAKQATDAGQTEPTSSPGGDKSAAAPAQDQAARPAGESKAPTPTALAGSPPQDTSAFQWLLGSKSDGSELILRGARFGFAGAYLYTLILLAQRGFRRDLTSGVAMWAAALFVLGPLAGALAALLVSGVVAGSPEGGFVRDAVFVFAGMLPREFSGYLQSSARRMLQPGATALALRTMPISMLRGATAAIEERLAEEGIEDVGSLAYASPFQLIRATSFDARQIVQWIDEALLISTVPEGWQELEKAGITGAIDLAWCHEHDASVTKLAGVTKIDEDLLKAIIQRLDEDAQVADLRCFYWSKEDEKATSDGASSRDRAAAKNQASPANQPTPSDDAGPGDEAAPKKAGPMISVRFETVAGVTPDAQDEIARAVAPDAEVSKNGPVVTLSNVDAKDQEKVRAMLGAEQRVAPDSFQVV